MKELLNYKCRTRNTKRVSFQKALVHNINILELDLKFSEEVVEILETYLQSAHLHLVVRDIKPFPRDVLIISRKAMLMLSKANTW